MIKLDIRRFYPTSDGRRVYDFFRERLQCSQDIATIFSKFCTIGDHQADKLWRTHLPTGAVTSPILAYYAYMEMFAELAALASVNGLTFSVLADDITFSGPNASRSVRINAEKIIKNYGLQPNIRKGRVVKADDPHKIITGVHLTSGGYRVPWKQLVKEGGLRAAIVSENQPLKRAKLYQTQTGVLFAAGQIQNGWLSNARAALAKWKNDKPAWDSHKSASGRRKKGPRKITILRKASAIVQKIRNSAA